MFPFRVAFSVQASQTVPDLVLIDKKETEMKKMKEVKISLNPFSSNLEVVENFVMMSHVPYSDSSVVVKIDPNIQDYVENNDQPEVKVRQIITTTETLDTQTLEFNFTDKNVQTINSDDRNFEIKLLEIGNENIKGIEGQKFRYFRFKVDEK